MFYDHYFSFWWLLRTVIAGSIASTKTWTNPSPHTQQWPALLTQQRFSTLHCINNVTPPKTSLLNIELIKLAPASTTGCSISINIHWWPRTSSISEDSLELTTTHNVQTGENCLETINIKYWDDFQFWFFINIIVKIKGFIGIYNNNKH